MTLRTLSTHSLTIVKCFIPIGRQKLGELIRSTDYEKVKGDPEDPLHPTAKLKYLKEHCGSDLTIDELKVMEHSISNRCGPFL